MRVVYFTDLHVNKYKQFDVEGSRLSNCLSVIYDVYEYCEKHEITTILYGGDLFDVQGSIETEVEDAIINCLSELTEEYPHIRWYAISGNHDQASKNLYDKPAITALKHLGTVFSEFMLIDNDSSTLEDKEAVVHGVPYFEFPEHYQRALQDAHNRASEYSERGYTKHILLIHQTPTGLPNAYIKTDTDVNDPLYDIFDLVLCGHIHTKQLITPSFLLGGSPLHRDLGDEGQVKGFWELDTKNPKGTLKFLSLKGKYPEYVLVKNDEEKAAHSRDYVIEEPEIEGSSTVGEANPDEFSSVLSAAQLIENYWQQETEGTDKELLKVGMEFI